ncbi:MAG: hypothetical protein U1E76_00380 [Planctomycetota bacterium]
MNRHATHLASWTLALAVIGPSASAQKMAEIGYSIHKIASGLDSPGQIDSDYAGNLYISSFADALGHPPENIYHMDPWGNVNLFTAPLRDPDSICVKSNGKVYVGAWPGRVTEIDPVSGQQTVFIEDRRLGNVDGIAFMNGGDLLVAPFDQSRIYRVDQLTKAITVFHDLGSRHVKHLSGIAVHPRDGRVFVSTPEQGKVFEFTPEGSMIGQFFAAGLAYPAAITIDPYFRNGRNLFIADYDGGVIYRLPLDQSEQVVTPKQVFVKRVAPHVGGVHVDEHGDIYFTRTDTNVHGDVFLVAQMKSSIDGTPHQGSTIRINLDSRADQNRYWTMMFSPGRSGFNLPDGRRVQLDPYFMMLAGWGRFDATGHAALTLPIPNDPAVTNFTFYGVYLSVAPENAAITGVSNVITINVQ